MKKIQALLACLILVSTAFAADIETFSRQMSGFYISPGKEAFELFQKNADELQKDLEHARGGNLLIPVMIARISQKHGWPVTSKAFGAKAREIAEGKSRLAQYISDDSLVNPGKLDIWWASFFATGERKYLNKIFRYAGKNINKAHGLDIAIVGAASWSFAANCRQHKAVREFALEQLQQRSNSQHEAALLHKCIDSTGRNSHE
jgi:hypothetical protein